MKAIHFLWPLLLAFITATGQVYAQPTIDSRVQKLEDTILALERRVASLEEKGTAPTPIPSDKMKWRKLRKGMSEGDVEKLLGIPSRVDAYGTFTIWHYEVPSEGQVEFDGKSQTVRAWHEL